MKKIVLLFSSVILFAGLTFAQTPQTQDKAAKPATKTECPSKEAKAGCDKKDMKNCAHSKEAKSCCAKVAKKEGPSTAKPEKK